MIRWVWGALLLAWLCPPTARAAERPHVYIVLVDGLDASFFNEQLTPTLWQIAHGGAERATVYLQARAAMPSVTNTNHVAIATAAYPDANGVVGNSIWDRVRDHPPSGTEHATFLEVETLFTVIKNEHPELGTAALFGKSRLTWLFEDVAGRQERPDVLWGDVVTETEGIDRRAGFASDQRTMDEVLRTIAIHDPHLLFTGLPDVDRTAHLFGPDSPETRRAVLQADREIGRLVEFVKRRGTWSSTVLMVTADHGFQSVLPALQRPYPVVLFGRELRRAGFDDVEAVSNGAIEFVYLTDRPTPPLDSTTGQRLKAIRALALVQPEIAEAWYRLPNPADGDDAFTLSHAHPDWHLSRARIGELVLVAQPHCTFADPFSPRFMGLSGDHGGPGETHIPILISGGDPKIRTQIVPPNGPVQAANPDLGATAAWLLGIRMPRTTAGRPVPPELAGRVLREAFE